MAAPIGVGDWVERIRPSRSGVFRAGTLYCVEAISAVSRCSVCDGCEGVLFRGLPRPSEAGIAATIDWWPLCCFRPIYRPRADFIEALKAPVTRTPRPAKKHREDA